MQIYLVGGAVRDQLLNLPVHEKDWVVVGATAEAMLQLGYKQVGKDFPVFLHPTTQEEYALARQERKTAPGYSGFAFNTDPSVTLEDDLLRRDLTINAIAQEANTQEASGTIIDPYNGQADLSARLLRHVSPAFAEDPVRILRVARFAARYHHLGFTIAAETMALMSDMVSAGEVNHLVAERIWKECSRALAEQNPQVFFATLRACGALAVIMPEIDALFGVPQRAEYHPEIDTGVHTLMSLEQAARLTENCRVRFATLLHDLGKAKTPPEILPRHHAHEQRSLPLINQFCARLRVPNDWRELALAVAEFHTHCHRALELKPSTLLKLFNSLGAFRQPEKLVDFCLCAEADARGRTGFETRDYPQAQYLLNAFAACQTVDAQQFIQTGLSGKAIGVAIQGERLNYLKNFVKNQ